ncbi:hypothetical protein HK405_007710 [Cladochytrium tenue]|nr:hypothetical protein HK405_007710 [Cladochytrium tenue]
MHLTNSPSSDYMTGLQAICVVVVAAFGVFAWFARRLLDNLTTGLKDLKGRVGDQQANDLRLKSDIERRQNHFLSELDASRKQIKDLRNEVDRLKKRKSDQDLPVGATVMFPILGRQKLSWLQDREQRFRLCNGGTLKKVEFNELYSIIGDAYRRPDCQDDEFNLPDFTDRYLRGGGHGANDDGAEAGGRLGGSLEIQGVQAKVDLRARTSEDGEHHHSTIDGSSWWYIRKLGWGGPYTMIDCGAKDPYEARTGNGGRHSHDVHVEGPVSVSGRIEPTFARVHVFIKVK